MLLLLLLLKLLLLLTSVAPHAFSTSCGNEPRDAMTSKACRPFKDIDDDDDDDDDDDELDDNEYEEEDDEAEDDKDRSWMSLTSSRRSCLHTASASKMSAPTSRRSSSPRIFTRVAQRSRIFSPAPPAASSPFCTAPPSSPRR